MEDIKKEYKSKFVTKRSNGLEFWDYDAFPDTVWSWIEQKIKEAKIEALYDIRGYADFMDNTLIEILHNKIKELKEKL